MASSTTPTLYLEPPVDVHGMGNSEIDGDNATGSSLTAAATRSSSGRTTFLSERVPTCFDVFASLWVNIYERSVPHAQREVRTVPTPCPVRRASH